jgi:hypothetical protein
MGVIMATNVHAIANVRVGTVDAITFMRRSTFLNSIYIYVKLPCSYPTGFDLLKLIICVGDSN